MYQKMQNNPPENVAVELSQPDDGNQRQVQVSEFANLEAGLKSIFGADFNLADERSQQMLLAHLKLNFDQKKRLADAIEADPRLGQMLADMVDGKRNAHSAMARYFGRSFMNVDEESPEFEEILMADEERREEIERIMNDRREYESNLEASRPMIEDFCNQKGYEPADFLELAWERLLLPILSGNYTQDVCIALDNALNYEQDVEDAFAAGNIKGRNTGIQRMRQDFGDGLPKGLTSVAPDAAPQPKRRNSLLDTALEA